MTIKKSKRIANRFKSLDLDTVSGEIIRMYKDLQYSVELPISYLRLVEFIFDAKYKGIKLRKRNVVKWPKLFSKFESVLKLVSPHISIYGQVVLRETLAHRYADFYRLRGKHESKFNEHYKFAYEQSKKHKFHVHIDKAACWNGIVYEKCKKMSQAAIYFNLVAQNRLSYESVIFPRLKVESAFDFFVRNTKYSPSNIRECVRCLVKQNAKMQKKYGDSISSKKMNRYKKL